MKELPVADKVIPFAPIQPRSGDLWGDRLLDGLPIGVYICDREGSLIRYNERAAELWGRAPALGEGQHRYCGAFRAFHPDGRAIPAHEVPVAEVLRTGQPVKDREILIERPDGTRIMALANIRPLLSDTDDVIGAVNCFQDITDRKRAEEAVKENERSLRELLEGLPAAIYTTDVDGRITFYNEAAAELWGCRPEIGTATWCGSWKLYHPDGAPMPHHLCPMAMALKQRRPVRGAEAIAERPDGTRVAFIPYPTLLHDAAGGIVGAVNMLVDITDQKASEERLRLLASEVDHRAKNMLAVIQAVVHLTQAGSIPEFKSAIDGRISALSRAHTLLSLGRWEGADMRRIVTEELAPHSAREGARVSINGPVLVLPPQLAQALALVVHELATNAAKHGALAQPGGRLELRWWGASDDRLLFRWTESGCRRAEPPARKGFGMSIIEGAIRQQLLGALEMDWRADGLRCEIEVPLAA
jgi:PAS domain S-box-containing protein